MKLISTKLYNELIEQNQYLSSVLDKYDIIHKEYIKSNDRVNKLLAENTKLLTQNYELAKSLLESKK